MDPYCFLITPTEPMALSRDKNLYLGRAAGNNIVVNDSRASRRHAELYYDGAAFVLNDLNSSNGTKVNDQDVTCKALVDGDVIAIGMATYTYRMVEDPTEIEKEHSRIRHDTQSGLTLDMATLPAGDFNGSLESMGMAEVCQTLGMAKRSGLLRIQGTGQGVATLYFKGGSIVTANVGDLEGDAAARQALQMERGSFSFLSNAGEPVSNVNIPTPRLLLEIIKNGSL